ncbi:MAG: alcohol dehydrogenase catalytic domain-containing protein [Actinobacteria bacterium]|nr:alcohol dehydrogenase catalytic domain-containing protein [Actinomycetota bacterium]
MKGIKIIGPKQVDVVDWPDPSLSSKEVKVRIKASALCRSDLSIYYMKPVVGKLPPGAVVPGHEPAGVIEEVGSAVDEFKKGDRVAISCFDGCGKCYYCKIGQPNLCYDMKCLGFDRHGGDAETLITPAATCLKIPDEMSFNLAAVSTDAIGNLYNSMEEIRVRANDRVAIIGVGPMGLSGVLCAKALGAEVIAIDLETSRLESALVLGADHVFISQEAEEGVKKLTNGWGVDGVVECSGATPAISLAFQIVKKLGRISQIGVEGGLAEINIMNQILGKKITYIGSWYFRMWEWDRICDFIIKKIGVENAEKIISHKYPLERDAVREAWQLFDEKKTDKVIFIP